MTAVAPTISSDKEITGLPSQENVPLPRSITASNPSAMMPIAVSNEYLVLHALYKNAVTMTVGAAITVERAMIALASATLRPSSTRELGNHSITPKLTRPQASAARVSAIVVLINPWVIERPLVLLLSAGSIAGSMALCLM